MPEADSAGLRRALVDYLRGAGALQSDHVGAALLEVPREVFLPGVPLDEVYRPSDAIVTKRVDGVWVSSASAPEVVAVMLEQLDPHPGDRVLEIGAGTGYNAALLARLVGPSGHVVTIDIDQDIVDAAREHVAEAGFADNVTVVTSDGALGAPGETFDRIILTVAADDLAPAWHEQLARPHGRLVLPLALAGLQRCVTFVRASDDPAALDAEALRNCSFITLRGEMAAPRSGESIDLDQLQARAVRATGISTQRWQTPGLHLWLAAQEYGLSNAWMVRLRRGEEHEDGDRGGLCFSDGTSFALVGHRNGSDELVLARAGEDSGLVDRLQRRLQAWVTAGRPTDANLHLRAYERRRSPAAQPGEVVIERRWTTFVLRWT
jgi:protein-L-isoaspartate(D-aspartate) O-methyltransferase